MSKWDDHERSSNPFYDDDSWGTERHDANMGAFGGGVDTAESRRDALLQKIKDSEESQLASQQRSLVHLYESEQMGIATAEELVRQGEQLDNIEGKATEINESMKTTQRHINSIKSVFGGLKNWFSKKETNSPPPEPVRKKTSRLNDVVENDYNEKESGVHPAIRLREEDTVDSPYGARQADSVKSKSNEEQFDENLGLMSSTLSRLKNMGMAFNDELESQNDQIERINIAVDRADGSVNRQTKQIHHILYK
ncbi:synaptosomal-associated protein 29-like [Tubulanus polymorphus]|uniref:synaptosomal-associated protein 29-like n=1 Tax=Tubulanus polymorphus TaxID=672921 RepID=UPI003DA392AE